MARSMSTRMGIGDLVMFEPFLWRVDKAARAKRPFLDRIADAYVYIGGAG